MKDLNFKKLVEKELKKARTKHGKQASVHEGYAILLEEVDEFWEHVRSKSHLRNYEELLGELVQIASCAQKTAEDVVIPKINQRRRTR